MAYRKIRIGTHDYHYAVGKSHVHIKGENLKTPLNFRNILVGEKYEWTCECCGEPLSRIGYRAEETGYNHAITPKVVRGLVENHLKAAA
jgi:hypothetical protein